MEIQPNITNGFQNVFVEGELTEIPAGIVLTAPISILDAIGGTTQLQVKATYADGHMADISNPETGTFYRSAMPSVATVSASGLVTAVHAGTAMLMAQHEGRLSTFLMTVCPAGDTDHDGIPDNVELARGLNPNNPLDARADFDDDGLTNLIEVERNTDINDADTDDDGVTDGAEVAAATDPTSAASVNYAGTGLLQSISVFPPSVALQTNTIIPQEISKQLTVTGTLVGGRTVNLTPEGTGTSYVSGNLLIANFGEQDGRVFAGNVGTTNVVVSNAGRSMQVPVTVTSFAPKALSFVSLPGYANSVDAEGNVAYVACGPAGLHVVNVTNPSAPVLLATRDTPGNANDVKFGGHTAFVADGPNGLVAIDVTNPSNPQIVHTLPLAGGSANDLFLCGDRAYVVSGSFFHIVNVSNPAAMSVIGSTNCSAGLTGVACDPGRNLAVVVGSGGLTTIDTSMPSAPFCIAGRSLSGSARDVCLVGTFALVAGGGPSQTLASVNIANAGNLTVSSSTPPPGNYNDCAADPVGLALCADVISVNSVHTFNIVSPGFPTAAPAIDFSGSPSFRDDNGTGIDVQRGLVYMTGNLGTTDDRGTSFVNGGLHIGRYLQMTDTAGVAPTVQILSPAVGAQVIEANPVLVQADASDDVAVQAVDFFVNGAYRGTDSLAPFALELEAPLPGPFTIGVRARDLADNVSALAQRQLLSIENPAPTVSITSPLADVDLIEGSSFGVTAVAMDDVAVARVDFHTSDGQSASDTTSPYAATFNVPTGTAALTVTAVALDNRSKPSATASVTLDVIPDPLTTVTGLVVHEGNPFAGADVHVVGAEAFASVTGADGRFLIANVPTIHPPIVVMASAMLAGQNGMGMSAQTAPVLSGVTDVGTITLDFRPPVTGIVAYLDDRQGGTGNATTIGAVGRTPLRLTDSTLPTTDLIHQFDVLIVALGNGSRNTALLQKRPGIGQFLRDGGTLIIHDSNPGANSAGDMIPGLNTATFQGLLTSTDVDVTDPASHLVQGPFGAATNATLDGGNFSTHGWVLANTLPAGVARIFHNGANSNQAVVICYRFGLGAVIWSSIPAEFYLEGGFPGTFSTNLRNIYLRNELSFALDLREGRADKGEIDQDQ